jgi:5'-deoxynucleotidase YfbR-like HD superfamily hydrolase
MKSKFISFCCLLIFMTGCQKDSEPGKNPLGFPFEKVSAKTENTDNPCELVDVIVRKENFSEENVDKLFRYFLRQYSERDNLIVRVYTSLENYQETLKDHKEIFAGPNDIGANPYFDAILNRMREHEWYMYNSNVEHHLLYTLNSSNREQVKIVYIKGDF